VKLASALRFNPLLLNAEAQPETTKADNMIAKNIHLLFPEAINSSFLAYDLLLLRHIWFFNIDAL
jgi:hypothetical protein